MNIKYKWTQSNMIPADTTAYYPCCVACVMTDCKSVFNFKQKAFQSCPPLMSTQKTDQREVNLCGLRHESRANEVAGSSEHHVDNTARPEKVSRFFFSKPISDWWDLQWPLWPPAAGPGTDTSNEQWEELSLIRSGLVIIKDGVLNQLPPWDSLCSRQWVMSVPGALKLTLIIPLKTITKQQELADVSGESVVTVDGVMFF